MLKSFKIYTCTNGSLGLHLSRAPWDPYPWVSSIQKESTSYVAGLRVGDCLLELNGNDVLGLKISEIAGLLKNHWLIESSNHVSAVIWRNKAKDATDVSDAEEDDDEDEENNAHNINQQSLQKFATCLQHIAQLLECPVCLEVVKPPGWQCCNGHVLCNNCRSRSEKCPVCRVPLGPRGRCLLSDKLFTLLADSFPCDGVRSNKSSPKDRRKCSTEFHNQPKMAIVSKQQHLDEDEVNAKDFKKTEHDFILSSLRMGRRRRTKTKKDETEGSQENKRSHHSMLARALYDATNAAVNVQVKSDDGINSRKSSEDCSATSSVQVAGGPFSATMTTTTLFDDELLEDTRSGVPAAAAAQCHCSKCYKPDKVAIVNNVMAATTTTSNKYILRVPAQQQEENVDHYLLHQPQQKYQNYQCPTGKLCCLQQNVMPTAGHATNVATSYQQDQQQQPHQLTNNNLSRKQTTSDCTESTNDNTNASTITKNIQKMLANEWEILAHLTQDHQLAVNQYYAEFGQRIAIDHDVLHKSTICLNLRGSEPSAKIEKFFVAFIPMAAAQTQHHQTETVPTTSCSSSLLAATKVAVFVWHMNALPNNGHSTSAMGAAPQSPAGDDDEVSNFDAIIENPKTGIKWFGRAHCLTTPWSHIYHKQHFLMHELMEGHTSGVPAANGAGGDGDAFVIVIKSKS